MNKLRSLRSDETTVSDFLESLEMPAPENWGATMRLALGAVEYTSHAKISVTPGKVSVYGLVINWGARALGTWRWRKYKL